MKYQKYTISVQTDEDTGSQSFHLMKGEFNKPLLTDDSLSVVCEHMHKDNTNNHEDFVRESNTKLNLSVELDELKQLVTKSECEYLMNKDALIAKQQEIEKYNEDKK